MDLQEMKSFKEKLIVQGREEYSTIASIVDTLGEFKTLHGRNYTSLEHDGITALHFVNILRAKVGSRQSFQGWLQRDYLFVTVGNFVPFCPFRNDKVMLIHLDNETTKENEIFVPYHMEWYARIMELLPAVKTILGEASKENSGIEKDKLSKSLFLDQNKNILGAQK